MQNNSALIAEQLRREQQQTAEARALAMKGLLEAIEAGDVDRVPAARSLIAKSFKIVSDELKNTLNSTKARTAGLEWLRLVGPATAVVILMRKLCSTTLRGEVPTIQRLGIDVGRRIIEEGAVIQAQRVNNLYMEKAYQYMIKRGVKSEEHARLTMKAAVQTVMHDSLVVEPGVALQTSKWVLNAAINTGLVEVRRLGKGKHTVPTYRLIPELEEMLFNTGFADSANGVGLVMIAPPNPWEPGMIGGYLAPTKNPLARKFRKEDHKLSRKGLEESAEYLAALNHMQSTPFIMDQRAVSIVRQVWLEGGKKVLSIPSIQPSPEPPFPFSEGWNKDIAPESELEMFVNWKHAKSEWYTAELGRKGEASRVGVLLREAVALKDKTIYTPTFGDWRGRMYYQGTPNPQGPDYVRACLKFKDEKPLGKDGLFWLKVHIANSFGQDKVRLKERAAWVDANMETLVDGMHRPQDSDAYRDAADYPVIAAVAVQELVAALDSRDPTQFCSGLPIHMDATCSGLQHYSALLRDPVGGRYVNLFDEGQAQKADVYAKVLEAIQVLLVEHLKGPESVLASLWLATALNRDLTKKPVMTYVYGATMRGVSTHCRQWLTNQGWEAPGVSAFAMGDFMAKLAFKAIATAVPAAASCMDWIKGIIRLNGVDKPLSWTTPIGTTIHQTYRNAVRQKVFIRSCNVESVMVLRDLETVRLQKMMSGGPPNFIHSLDSSHAARVVNAMAKMGKQVVSIHDSIGTHPGDVTTLQKVVRQEFHDMYMEHDPLSAMLKMNGIEAELPERGTLDLTKVIDSEFFFC